MRYRFGAFELDDDQYELRQSGVAVHIEPRVLDVLFFLVRNRDRVVSREELLDGVWKTRYIGESALSRCIMQARKAVSVESSDEPIRTVHRRGYRFVAPVDVDEATQPDSAPPIPVAGAFDPQAEKLCSRAMEHWKKRLPSAMLQAIALLQESIALEPHYARAHALLGDCYLFLGFLQQTAPKSVFPKAEAALARSIELDPTLADAYASRAFIEMVYGWNPVAAGESLAEALRRDRTRAIVHHRIGMHLLAQRQFDDAESALRHAAALDPLSPIFATACALPSMGRGEPAKAVPIYRTVVESEPAFFPAHFYLGLALEACGREEEAMIELRRAAFVSEVETEALPALAHALGRAGRVVEAEEIHAQLRAAEQRRFISPFFFAVVHLGQGDYDATLDALEEAVEARAMRLHDLHLDPRFAPLHGDPRYQRIVASIGVDPEAKGTLKWWGARRS